VVAHVLIAEGFTGVEELIDAGVEELSQIDGFDEEIAAELLRRAEVFIEKRDSSLADHVSAQGMDPELQSFTGFPLPVLVKLVDEGVKTVNDFADLAADELIDIIGSDVATPEVLGDLIMQARARWDEGDVATA
jgi:N utilization substance protein A